MVTGKRETGDERRKSGREAIPGYRSPPLPPRIEAPVLDRFGEVFRADACAVGEVGDRACDAQYPVVGPRGKPEALDGTVEQGLFARFELALALDRAVAEPGVGLAAARELARARGGDPRRDRRARFAGLCGAQLGMRDARHFEFQVDAVEQRARQARAVPCDRIRRAAAAARHIARMTA